MENYKPHPIPGFIGTGTPKSIVDMEYNKDLSRDIFSKQPSGIMINTNNPITIRAASKWGEKQQKAILMEECAELISAIARHTRGRTSTTPVAEEVADVIVSMMSVIPVLNIEKEVKKYMNDKLNRLSIRLDNHHDKNT